MTHKEYYEKICKPAFEEILVEVRTTNTEVGDIKKRLFVDNGETSIQSRLNKQDGVIKIWCWIVGIIGVAALTGLIDTLVRRIF